MTKPFKDCSYVPYPKGSVTQFFGENPALYSTVCAAPGTCLTGGHNGIDLVAPWGTPIFNVMAGKVVEVKNSPNGYGMHVRVLCVEDSIHSLEWVYGHLSRIDVKVGDMLAEGAQIGLMGNTGFVVSGATPYWKHNPYAGTHLHLGVRRLRTNIGPNDSWSVSYPSGDKGIMLNYGNGYLGSIDPMPLLSVLPKEMLVDVAALLKLEGPKRLTAISLLNQLKTAYEALFREYQKGSK